MKLKIKAIEGNKNHYLLFLLMFVIIYIFFSQIYPYRLWKMEEDNLFILTSDFTKAVLTSPAGVAEWIGLWLAQWYGNVIVGILINTVLLSLLGVISYYTMKENKLGGGMLGFAALPVVATMWASFYAHSPVIIVSQIALWGALLLYSKIGNYSLRLAIFAVLIPIMLFLIPGGALIFLYISIALVEMIRSPRSSKSLVYILLAILAAFAPVIWNYFYYEPIAVRYSMFTNAEIPTWLTIFVFLPCLISIFNLSKVKHIAFYWAYVIIALLLGTASAILYKDSVFKNSEESYHLEYLAENRMWNRILQRGMDSELSLYDLRMKYSVLSLIELNKLPELLFSLPVTPMLEYTYPSPNSRMTYGLNSRFYKSLNLTNEAMHNLFQDACMSDYGMNFRDLRNLAQCAKISGNEELARKYLSIYSRSNLNTTKLEEFVNASRGEAPRLPQLFSASTDVKTLMRVLSSQYSTTSINDCLLCNLLMKKDLATFAQVAPFCLTSPELVRGCYKEAALLCKVNNIPCRIEVTDEALRAYSDLQQMMQTGNSEAIDRKFAGSYLKYYFSDINVEKIE